MTFTYNGVGTNYVGNRNSVSRSGSCQHCGRGVRLSSYDTRLWFVVLFVPVIPLGRKRIVDKCPRCTRHHAIDWTKWLSLQQESREQAEALLRERQNDPAAAIEAHAVLEGIHLFADADALAETMERKFGHDASVRMHLADVLDLRGKGSGARAHYEAAHRIDPALPAAREALAFYAAQEGEVDAALDLMQPVLDAGNVRSGVAARAVAAALLGQDRPAEARAVLGRLLEALPSLGDDKSFAQELATCEERSGSPRTPLAARRRAGWQMVMAAGVLLGVVVLFLGADLYAAAHRTLHVVNGPGLHVVVDIPGAGSVEMTRPGTATLVLPVGTHVARVTGDVEREIRFTVEAPTWPRFFDTTTCVLDPTGSSILVLEQGIYTVRGDSRSPPRSFLFGKDFITWPAVDRAFAPLPNQVKLDGSSSRVLTRIALMEGSAEEIVYGLIGSQEAMSAFSIAQWALKRETDSRRMLAPFLAAAYAAHNEATAAGILAPRLDRRPLDLDAHMAWQDLRSGAAGRAEVEARYAKLRAESPDDAATIFLSGRVSRRVSERIEVFERATGDPLVGPRAWIELAEAHASAGDWRAAQSAAMRALDSEPDEWRAHRIILDSMAALGQTGDLRRALDEMLAIDPCNLDVAFRRVEVDAASPDRAGMDAFLADWEKRAARACSAEVRLCARNLRIHGEWVRGDYARVVEHVASTKDGSLDEWALMAQAERGAIAEVHAWLDRRQKVDVDGFTALGIAIACRAADDVEQATAWERLAQKELHGTGAGTDVAHVLCGEESMDAGAALDLYLPHWEKSVFLASLACRDEGARSELLAASLALQPRSLFPRRSVERLAAADVSR